MSTDPLKETIERIVKNHSFWKFSYCYLKHGGEWILKIQNSTIMVITVMKSSQKLTKWKIWLPFPKDKDKYLDEDWKAG